MYQATQREYTEQLTGEVYTLFMNSDTQEFKLLNEINDREVTRFVLCAFTNCDYKFKEGITIRVNKGNFLDCTDKPLPTHRKFFFEKRFKKI